MFGAFAISGDSEVDFLSLARQAAERPGRVAIRAVARTKHAGRQGGKPCSNL